MIEKIVLDYLNQKLSVPVYMENPKDHPADYVLIEKTSSTRKDHVNSALFAIQSYGNSLYDAASLNENVKKAMDDIAFNCMSVSSAKLNSDYNYTNTAKKQYRYQAVYNIFY